MAGDANTPRKASAKLLKQQLHALHLTAGILIKSTRSYKRAGKPSGLRQTDVATAIGKLQGEISRVENGTLLFPDPVLCNLLTHSGFDMSKPGGSAMLKLLQFIRDHSDDIEALKDEKP